MVHLKGTDREYMCGTVKNTGEEYKRRVKMRSTY